VVYLAVVPLVSAWATIVTLGGVTDALTAGFSDVNSALLGYLVAVWFAALAAECDRVRSETPAGVDPRWSVVVAFASLALAYLAPSGAGYFRRRPPWGRCSRSERSSPRPGCTPRSGARKWRDSMGPERELLYVTGASVAAAGVIGSLVLVPFGSNVCSHISPATSWGSRCRSSVCSQTEPPVAEAVEETATVLLSRRGRGRPRG